MLTRIDHSVLNSNPNGMSLILPGIRRPIQVVKVPNVQAPVSVASSQQQAERLNAADEDVWVGEVVGQQPSMSVVTLLTEDFSVYGTIRYYDERRKAFRSFRILPTPGSSTTAQRLSADNVTTMTMSAEALAQQQENQDYVVVEFREPTKRRAFAGGEAAIKAAARDAVARTNKAYADTGLNVRQNLLDARLVSVNYNEFSRSNSGDVLDDLRNNRIPNVHAWRDQPANFG
ncbi:hypothetical protein COO60DRAFT_1635142 [Scenedesmus sp. NREL 46B-D3]|nr:hypothetical protein COO60DRAFT_1635142 [Scenedesmus sp. NREL 46B-D3]